MSGFKFREYRRIESLREYVLISQFAPHIELYSLSPEGDWRLRDFVGPDAICRFTSIDCEIKVTDVYRDVQLDCPVSSLV